MVPTAKNIIINEQYEQYEECNIMTPWLRHRLEFILLDGITIYIVLIATAITSSATATYIHMYDREKAEIAATIQR